MHRGKVTIVFKSRNYCRVQNLIQIRFLNDYMIIFRLYDFILQI